MVKYVYIGGLERQGYQGVGETESLRWVDGIKTENDKYKERLIEI